LLPTRSGVGKGQPARSPAPAATTAAATPGAYFITPSGNPDNPAAHQYATGPELIGQMAEVGGFDAIVCGCGSSGTMTGLSRCLAEQAPDVEMVLADPVRSEEHTAELQSRENLLCRLLLEKKKQ